MIRATALCLAVFAMPTAALSTAPTQPALSPAVNAQIERDIAQHEYHARHNPVGLQAANRQQGFRSYFDAGGVTLVDRQADTTVLGSFRLSAWGRAGSMTTAVEAKLEHDAQRVRLRRPGLLEWFENRPDGLEQGFEIAQRRAGQGDLLLRLAVGDAELRADRDAIELQQGEQALRYEALKVWDASGRILPAQMAVVGNQIELRIDDAQARYPVTVDPLISAVADAQLESNQGSGQSGHSVSYAGDLNGDGFGDIAVGAFGFDGGATNSGAVFVYFGSAGAFNAVADGQMVLNTTDARLGGSVAGAGDLNGDGFADLVVGAASYANGQTNEGAAFVYFGGAGASFNTTADGVLENNQIGAFMGGSVAGIGDINGDGFIDIAVGAASWDNSVNGNEGRVFVYFGGAGSSFDTTADVQPFSSQVSAAFGSGVAGGDLNGDGFSDLVVGAVLYDNGQIDEGNAFVYFGGASVNTVVDVELQSNLAGAQLGASVAVVGDVNGDGFADVLAGAPNFANGQIGEGAALLYFGGAAMNNVVDAVLEGNQVDAEFARSVAAAQDVNGDGYADVLIGAPLFDVSVGVEGAAFLYLGGPGAFDLVSDKQLSLPTTSRFGFSVAAGDVNRDGFSDVLVGAPSLDGGLADEGAALLYFGGALTLNTLADGTVSSAQGSGQSGHSVASGDLNGDGFADLVVGAFGYDRPGFTNAGAAFVYFGSAGAFNTVADAQLGVDQLDARFGTSVAVGDVNADGFDDVIVGAAQWDGGQSNEGAAFVYFGGGGAFNLTADATLQGDQVDAQFGSSVAVIGDSNGDGFNDIAVGAQFFDNGSTDEGAVFVYFGATGINTEADGLLEINQGSAFLGTSVAAAGDVNGDGFADLIAGGTGFDATGASNSGVAQIYFGGAGDRINSVADAELTSSESARFGSSVAGAGDVNGDGFADVIVGAFEWSGGQVSEGAAFLYFGGSGAFNLVADAQFELNQAGAGLGSGVAGGGDLNGDGFGDVVIGAHLYDNGQAEEGAAFVYFGGTTVNTVVDAQFESDQANARLGHALAVSDVNGDGATDVIVGAPGLDLSVSDDGAAVLYLGNGNGRVVQAQQFNSYLDPVSRWSLARSTSDYVVAMDVTSPRGRERARLEVESCPSGRAFSAPQCVRVTSPTWIDLGNAGASLAATVSGLGLNSVHHWRARAQYLPLTATSSGIVAPSAPTIGPWRNMQADTGVGEIRISDVLFVGDFE